MRENSQMLLTYLRSLAKTNDLIDEIYQLTMVTAWQKLDDYDKSRPFAPWLRGIAKNHLLTHYRKSKREVLMCNEQVFDFLEQHFVLLEQNQGDDWDDKIQSLKLCIEKLPDKYRQAIEARYIREQKTEFVKMQLAISADALKKRLQRAKHSLYQCLVKQLQSESENVQ